MPVKLHLGLILAIQQEGISSDSFWFLTSLWSVSQGFFLCNMLSVQKRGEYLVPLGNGKPEAKAHLSELCWKEICSLYVAYMFFSSAFH